MSNLIVIHGSFGSPRENWFGWLCDSWIRGGFGDVAVSPSLPSPKMQTFENWSAILDGYAKAGVLNDDATVVAHSSACVFAIKYLDSRRQRVSTLATVSGFNDFFSGDETFDRINAEMFVDDQLLRSASTAASRRFAFYGKDDPYLPQETLAAFADAIDAKTVVVPDGGHLNTESGYTEFAQLLQAIGGRDDV